MDLSKYKNVTYIDHPLLKHKITRLRDVKTPTNEFRTIVKEIAFIEGYEALRDLPTHLREIETPIEKIATMAIKTPTMKIAHCKAGLTF